jgi:hypothetical protein
VLIGLADRYSRETATLRFPGAYERYQAFLAGFPDDPGGYRAAVSSVDAAASAPGRLED